MTRFLSNILIIVLFTYTSAYCHQVEFYFDIVNLPSYYFLNQDSISIMASYEGRDVFTKSYDLTDKWKGGTISTYPAQTWCGYAGTF
jgi:hypothetical protein